MREGEQRIADNAAAPTVLELVRQAEAAGRRAAEHDQQWLSLSGGLSAVRLGLERDDGHAAGTGIRVVRTECDEL